MTNPVISSPHVHGPANVSGVMLRVVYALLPAIAGCVWLFGWGVVVNLLVAITAALVFEAAFLALRRRPIIITLRDGSALVTAVLLAVALPPLAPWWLVTVGVLFAIVFAKQLYGGLGFNPFNPAMAGYVLLLVSFPQEMTNWAAPAALRSGDLGLVQVLLHSLTGALPTGTTMDALSSATALDTLKVQLGMAHTVSEIRGGPIFGLFGGRGWEIVNGLILLGGLWLLWRRVITWHVPAAVLGSLALIATLFHLINPELYAGPLFHLASGGAMLGAFFIATDPVSGATSPRGQLVFGAGMGVLIYVIRTWGGFPDGVAFAVLLMNMAAPAIDYYTQPRVYGHNRG
ncbi:MAG: electron transport complex subunit RsxD [Gammaproteobacteria bacterium HGW-Gammaproteobacteria-1]|jgi:electron transport complex protein RnfD|nr:MAG: electron transport complex subunit RsxD [Gammaproteobacteria bacterium HGW-Gammaproteobacteria-1]